MRKLPVFTFGAACGAWLNIWPATIDPWWSFGFAYVLVFIALGTMIHEKNRRT